MEAYELGSAPDKFILRFRAYRGDYISRSSTSHD